jgi:hypothetical protein
MELKIFFDFRELYSPFEHRKLTAASHSRDLYVVYPLMLGAVDTSSEYLHLKTLLAFRGAVGNNYAQAWILRTPFSSWSKCFFEHTDTRLI